MAAQNSNDNALVKKPGKTKLVETPLDKAKKEFSRLLNSIEKLKQEAETREASLTSIKNRIQQEIKPLMDQTLSVRLEINQALESNLADKSFSRKEKKTLVELLFYNCALLEEMFGQDMTEVRLRHMTAREKREYEEEMEQAGDIEQILNDFFGGVTPGGNPFGQPEEAEQPKKKQGRKRKPTADSSPEDSPQPDAIDPQVKKKLDLQRYMRSLYLSLVKSIHPDLEQDEEKKWRRTELMQKVSVAYQHLDLYELLKARKELLEIEESEHLEKSLEIENKELDQLKQYIKILKSQQQEIQSAHYTQRIFSPDAALLRKFIVPNQSTDKVMDKEKKKYKKEVKRIIEIQQILMGRAGIHQYLAFVHDLPYLEGYF
ncbi:MAG: hypothetical protein V4714_20875 [Bacteroidota bacterium]